MRDSMIKFRIERDQKRKALVLGIPISSVCRTAMEQAIRTREKRGQLQINPIQSFQDAVRTFNAINPAITALLNKHPELLEQLDTSPDVLEVLKTHILEIPDKYFLDFARFISGNGHSHKVFIEFLNSQEELADA